LCGLIDFFLSLKIVFFLRLLVRRIYIACDLCQEWFHPSCIGMTDEDAEREPSYTCAACSRSPLGRANVARLDDEEMVAVVARFLKKLQVERKWL